MKQVSCKYTGHLFHTVISLLLYYHIVKVEITSTGAVGLQFDCILSLIQRYADRNSLPWIFTAICLREYYWGSHF